MELRGKLVHITREPKAGKEWITFGVDKVPPEAYSLQEKDLAITVKPYRKKRSLNANAYYWALIEEIATATGTPKPMCHNMMLRRYGVLEQVEGENLMVFIPDTDEADNKVMNAETYHFRPTSRTKTADDGRTFRAYLVLKGSSAYDTKEMAALIEGVISEAKELGIEILPREEYERMMKSYEEHFTGR